MAKEILLQKEAVIKEIVEKLKKAKSVVLVDYRGINVDQDTKLRKELRDSGVEYKVYKNRLAQRAMNEVGFGAINNELQDTTAIAISYNDVVAPSKIIIKCAKEFNKLTIKGGIIEGQVSDKATMVAIANIPSKETLLAQLLGLLTSPMRSLAVALSEVAKKTQA